MKLIANTKNGNYRLMIFDNGTKIRDNGNDVTFNATWPESMDLKITNKCMHNCVMCHEASTTTGQHGDIDAQFLKTLPRGMEVAIGGGDPMTHPQLTQLLNMLKTNGQIANMTVHSAEYIKNYELLTTWQRERMLYGLGVSYAPSLLTTNFEFNDNTIVHVIAGMIDYDDLCKLRKNGAKKILILGYKRFRRGEANYEHNFTRIDENIDALKRDMKRVLELFDVVSFDNLALSQLDIKSLIDAKTYETCYMGDEGQFTMYVDLVTKTFATNSTQNVDEREPLMNDIRDMFTRVKQMSNH